MYQASSSTSISPNRGFGSLETSQSAGNSPSNPSANRTANYERDEPIPGRPSPRLFGPTAPQRFLHPLDQHLIFQQRIDAPQFRIPQLLAVGRARPRRDRGIYIYIYIAGISATPRPTQAEASARRPSRLAPRSHDFRAPAVELALVDDNVLGIRQNALSPHRARRGLRAWPVFSDRRSGPSAPRPACPARSQIRMVTRLPFQPKTCRSIISGEIPRACCRCSRRCGGRLRWYSRASSKPSDIILKLTRLRQTKRGRRSSRIGPTKRMWALHRNLAECAI